METELDLQRLAMPNNEKRLREVHGKRWIASVEGTVEVEEKNGLTAVEAVHGAAG